MGAHRTRAARQLRRCLRPSTGWRSVECRRVQWESRITSIRVSSTPSYNVSATRRHSSSTPWTRQPFDHIMSLRRHRTVSTRLAPKTVSSVESYPGCCGRCGLVVVPVTARQRSTAPWGVWPVPGTEVRSRTTPTSSRRGCSIVFEMKALVSIAVKHDIPLSNRRYA